MPKTKWPPNQLTMFLYFFLFFLFLLFCLCLLITVQFAAVAAVAAAAGGVDPTYFSTTFQTPDTSYATFNYYTSPYNTRYTYI